jgi:hypothetical protein
VLQELADSNGRLSFDCFSPLVPTNFDVGWRSNSRGGVPLSPRIIVLAYGMKCTIYLNGLLPVAGLTLRLAGGFTLLLISTEPLL